MRRIAVLMALGIYAITAIAQNSIPAKLSHVLEVQDMDMGLKLYKEITDNDLKQLPDSSLFDYHYLGGYLNSEISNHEKTITHLLEAKRLCDTSLGTYSIGYMEIMDNLGDEYLQLEQCNEALSTYQEGIVKSMAVRNSAPQNFGNLIIGVQKCYERFGWFNEIPAHLLDAWSFWPKDEIPLKTYTYYPLWNLEQFYYRYGIYDKALSISDKIETFIISKAGDNHPELCNALYFRGNILRSTNRRKEAILTYEKAISIAKSNNIPDSELLGLLYGNILATIADDGDIEHCYELLPAIKAYGSTTNDERFYANSLYTCALHLGQSRHYHEALSVIDMIPIEGFSNDELEIINNLRKSYLQNKETLSNFDNLLLLQSQACIGSSNWYNVSYEIANGYMLQGNLRQCLKTLETIYSAYEKESTNQGASPLSLINSLLNLTTQLEQDSSFLKYALVKHDLLNSNKDLPKEYLIGNINEIIAGQLRCRLLEGIDERLNQIESYYRTQYGETSNEYAIYLHNRGRAFQLQNKLDEAKATLLRSISIQNKIAGRPMEKTFKYFMEVEKQLSQI